MTIDLMKDQLIKNTIYSSPTWTKKVNLMSPTQIVAIYTSMLQRKQIINNQKK